MERKNRIGMIVCTLLLVLGVTIFPKGNGLTVRAEASGTVTAASAKIRKSPDTSSEVVGSALNGAKVTIKSQTTGADGNTWYEVYITGGETGYTRSDLVQKGEGSIPTTTSATPAAEPAAPAVMAPTVEVTAVEHISAMISGGQSVRVRADASTSGGIVTSVAGGTAVTVTGQATGTDGNTWYQISFAESNGEVAGFVRSDFLTLSGEVVPAGSMETEIEPAPVETEEAAPAQETKEYETALQGDTWYLLHNSAGVQYKIGELIDAARVNAENYQKSLGTIKKLKIGIVALAVVAVLAISAFLFLLLRRKNEEEDLYYGDEEHEPLTPGREKITREKRQRPRREAGEEIQDRPARPAGQPGQQAGTRPGASAGTAGPRPSGAARPAAKRPDGKPGAAPVKPGAPAAKAGTGAPSGDKKAVRRPAAPEAGAQNPEKRPQAPARPDRPVPGREVPEKREPARGPVKESGPSWKSKNFIEDDDEFEFEFLNWDEEDM